MKCRYGHCKCGGEIEDDNYIKIKNSYYHPGCYQENENIKATMSLFKNEINENVVMAELRRVINTIVYNKGIDSAFLLFGLQWWIKNKRNLNYPQGLHYVIQSKEVQNAWNNELAKDNRVRARLESNNELELDSDFEYISQKMKTIGDIFNE